MAMISIPADFVELRRAHIAEHGPMTMDSVLTMRACTKCGHLGGYGFGTNAACGFGSIKELVESASKLAANNAARQPTTACTCGEPLKQVIQYHAFHSGLECDLVVLWKPKAGFFGKPSVELLKWDQFGAMLPLEKLSLADESRFVHDAAFRKVFSSFAVDDAKEAVDQVEQLSERYPSDPLLLRFIPIMLKRRYERLGLRIADAHRKTHPDDAEGHHWFGEVLLMSMNYKVEPMSRAPEARAALEKALAQQPTHLPAALSLCLLLQLENRSDDAKAAFSKLILVHPESAEAHFNLGLLLFDDDPASALEHLRQGEKLAPNDPDYAVASARALIALARKDEARESLKRARNITKTHPRFAELETSLEHNVAHPSHIAAKKRIWVELILNGARIAEFNPGHEPKTGHLLFDLPRGNSELRMLLGVGILPPGARELALTEDDVISVRVRSDEPTDLIASGWSGDNIKGEGVYDSPEIRFEVAINSKVLATIGNPMDGGLSVDLAVLDRNEKIQISLHATGSDETEFRHWAFPNLQANDVATIRILGGGEADEPGASEPRKKK